jgi:hypothetical protein
MLICSFPLGCKKPPLLAEMLVFRRGVPQWIQVKKWDFIARDAIGMTVQRISVHFDVIYFYCCLCCA